MNEHGFIRAVHKRLAADIYAWKIHDPFTGGIPDCWYNNTKGGYLYVEYKYLRAIPKRANTMINLVADNQKFLSKLQQNWLETRYVDGINVAVIVGSPEGGVVFTDLSWKTPIPAAVFSRLCVDIGEIALNISQLCYEYTPHEKRNQTQRNPERQANR